MENIKERYYFVTANNITYQFKGEKLLWVIRW